MSSSTKYQLIPSKEDEGFVHDNSKYCNCCGYPQPKRQVYIFSGVLAFVLGFLIVLAILLTTDNTASHGGDATCNGFVFTNHSTVTYTTQLVTFPSANPSFPYHQARLPTSLKPFSYGLFLQPNYDQLKNNGNVTIGITCHRNTNFIVFHIRDIQVQSIQVIDQFTGDTLSIKRTLQDVHNDYYYVQVDSQLTSGSNYTLHIVFEGKIYTTLLRGFYRSSYITTDGGKRFLYVTDFEPTDARLAFPCFDEPNLKATFALTIEVPSGYNALFNMPSIYNRTLPDNRLLIHFDKTPPMSTYLVAYVVSDYEHLQNYSSDNILVRTWMHKDKINETRVSLKVATDSVAYFGQIFNIVYPLPKIDLIAIPDYSSGGMENWGLITFNEVQFMYNTKYSTTSTLISIVETVAHEIAHQWFGDLVTMEWWSDVWLNEGFATFVSFLGMRNSMPELQAYQQFVLRTYKLAIIDDSLPSSHPVYQPVNNPKQIGALFDHISYNKGASLLRMIYEYFGASAFFEGVEKYLKAHAFQNAKSQDLWKAMSSVTGEDINSIMNTWLLQMNYPLITVSLTNKEIIIKQARFLEDKNGTTLVNTTSPYNYKWKIPFCYETDKGLIDRTLIGMNGAKISLNALEKPKWIKANCNQTGFYRVNYDAAMWEELIRQIRSDHQVFNALDKANLMDDAFHLTKIGCLGPSTFLNLSRYLINETEYVPFATAIPYLKFIVTNVNDISSQTIGKKYLNYLLQPNIKQLGWQDFGMATEKLLRARILSAACFTGDKKTILKVKDIFRNWLLNGKNISVDLKPLVLSCGITHGSVGEWNTLLERFHASSDAAERRVLLSALAASTEKSILKKLLNILIDKTKVRSLETVKGLIAVARNPIGTDLTWNFVVIHWNLIYERYSADTFSMAHIISHCIAPMKTQVQLDKVKLFFKCVPDVGTGQNAVPKAIDKLETKIAWRKINEKGVSNWFIKVQKDLQLS